MGSSAGRAAVTGCRRALITLVDEYPAQRLRVIVNQQRASLLQTPAAAETTTALAVS